jgi:hypothetical protein
MIQYRDEEVVVEFKSIWELCRYLPDTVDELQKNGRAVSVRMMVITVSNSLSNKQLRDHVSFQEATKDCKIVTI